MKQISTLIFIFLIGLSTYAQRAEEREDKEIKLAVKWSPLHLIAQYPTVQLALEHRLANKFSIQYEGGLVLPNSSFLSDAGASDFNGFKTNVEVRRHFFPRSNKHFYLATQVFFNRVNYRQKEDFIIHPELEESSKDYYQTLTYGMRFRDAGGVIKVGGMKSFGRFCIDVHVGISLSHVDKYAVNKPQYQIYDPYPDNGSIVDNIYLPFDDDHLSLHPTAGIRIGYIIR